MNRASIFEAFGQNTRAYLMALLCGFVVGQATWQWLQGSDRWAGTLTFGGICLAIAIAFVFMFDREEIRATCFRMVAVIAVGLVVGVVVTASGLAQFRLRR